jgi:hypothetical protein
MTPTDTVSVLIISFVVVAIAAVAGVALSVALY